jgi:hypothetical protein
VKENQVEWERAPKRGGVENTKTRCREHQNAVFKTPKLGVTTTPKLGVKNTKQNAVWKKNTTNNHKVFFSRYAKLRTERGPEFCSFYKLLTKTSDESILVGV